MQKFLSRVVCLLVASCFSHVAAQPVLQASAVVTQPQVGIKGGVYESCGVRVVSFSQGNVFPMRAIDYSINLYFFGGERGFMGLAKYTAVTFPSLQALQRKQSQPIYVADAWLKPQERGDLPPVPTAKPLRGEDPNALLVGLQPVPLMQFLGELIGGPKKALVGVRARSDKILWVTAHTIQLKPEDAETFSACIDGLLERVQKWAGEGTTEAQPPNQ